VSAGLRAFLKGVRRAEMDLECDLDPRHYEQYALRTAADYQSEFMFAFCLGQAVGASLLKGGAVGSGDVR
jgi:hypothetical protein